jgi:hypothetical protein
VNPLRGLILRLDTNQGISGYGDTRDGAKDFEPTDGWNDVSGHDCLWS